MENNNATLVEAKKAYTNQLVSLITPQIYEGIKDLYECAKKNMKGKNTRHSFQIELQAVSLWNQIIIENETERIISNTNCNYLDKLVTVIFINSTKILAAAYIGFNNTNTLEISVPKLSHFIHRVYIETAKEFYKNPYLLDEDLRPRERQENLRSSIGSIKFGIEQAILKLLPIGEILSRDINKQMPEIENNLQPKLEDIKEDSDEDIEEDLNHAENDAENENFNEDGVDLSDYEDSMDDDVSEENFVTEQISNTGSEDDGINVEEINENNKEFIEEKKNDPNLVDDIVEEINLKNIDLKESNEKQSSNDITINRVDEEADLNNIEESNVNFSVGKNKEESEIVVPEEDNSVNKLPEEQASEEQASVEQASVEQASVEQASVEQASEEQASVEQASVEKELETSIQENSSPVEGGIFEGVSTSIEEDENTTQLSDTIQMKKEEVNETVLAPMEEEKIVESVSTPVIETENSVQLSETSPEDEDVAGEEDLNNELEKNNYVKESNNMLKSMKDELIKSKTVFVNPYRSKRNINSKRLERLRNVRIKKRQNSQEDFY
jgi:hypothetical protein